MRSLAGNRTEYLKRCNLPDTATAISVFCGSIFLVYCQRNLCSLTQHLRSAEAYRFS